jgi:hypothetical protein
MNFTDFFVKGYTQTYDYEILDLIGKLPDLSEWNYCKEELVTRSPKNINLKNCFPYISKNYVEKITQKYEIGYSYIWEGVHESSNVWHNDLIEGYNLFFMYYLTDVNCGGEICFRMNGEETGCIQPKKGLLVMGSQEKHVEHRVNFTEDIRIACNFGFKI